MLELAGERELTHVHGELHSVFRVPLRPVVLAVLRPRVFPDWGLTVPPFLVQEGYAEVNVGPSLLQDHARYVILVGALLNDHDGTLGHVVQTVRNGLLEFAVRLIPDRLRLAV